MITLYIKTHKITGLKYFGKTTKQDVESYLGSGIYWRKHLQKYGREMDTKVIGIFADPNECSCVALEFSRKNNIVESKEWANLKEENGLDGSPPGVKFSDKHRAKLRQNMLGICNNPFTDKTRNKMSNSSRIREEMKIKEGNHIFCGEQGSKLAKERNKKLSQEGKHNFQIKGMVSVTDKNGIGSRITKTKYDVQTGIREDWQYVSVASNESKRRRGIL